MKKGNEMRTKKPAFWIVAIIAFVICFPACGGGNENVIVSEAPPQHIEAQEPESATVAAKKAEISFFYKGIKIIPGEDIEPLIEQLGEPNDVFVAPSCAFIGEDRIYYYQGVDITTWPKDEGANHVLSYTFRDDSVQTEQGVYLGIEKGEIEKIYGPGKSNDDGTIVSWFSDNEELRCFFENGAASDVTVLFSEAQEIVEA